MAKPPTKKKQTKKTKVTIDRLAVGLEVLAETDKESTRALRALSEAIDAPFEEPDFENCKFEFNGTKYKAKLTAYQCKVVSEAVETATTTEQIEAVVNVLLGELSGQANAAFDSLTNQLGDPTKPVKDVPGAPAPPPPTGCCVYDGGKIANLTEARCQVFQPSSWGLPADCSASAQQ
jgi:hypothetical protein